MLISTKMMFLMLEKVPDTKYSIKVSAEEFGKNFTRLLIHQMLSSMSWMVVTLMELALSNLRTI
jgi:hypothetical protein